MSGVSHCFNVYVHTQSSIPHLVQRKYYPHFLAAATDKPTTGSGRGKNVFTYTFLPVTGMDEGALSGMV